MPIFPKMRGVPKLSKRLRIPESASGDSAYEIAVAGGFVGTVAEWLASLKGEKGDDGAAVDVSAAIAAYFVANPLSTAKSRVSYHNRLYFYADRRWVSAGDANFGFDDVNSSETGGTAATPIVEWENQGIPFEAGDRITSLQFRLRVNNLEPADVEFYVVFVAPDLATRWITGYDGDAEVTATVLHNDVHLGRTGALLTANINDRTRQVIDLDYTCPAAGELRVFARPVGTPTATRYCYCNTIVDYEAA